MAISSASIHHGKILIVDDEKANVLLLEQMLRFAGYDAVSSTVDSTKVCELHLMNHFDLILLDLKMPGMDGFQVMENLKTIETGGYLPVLVVTAQPDHKLRALQAGAKDFISKPFDRDEVLIRVYNMLEVRLLHMETLRLYERVVAGLRASEKLMLMMQPSPDAVPSHGRPEAMADGSGEPITESNAEVLQDVLNNIFTRLDDQDGNPVQERSEALGDAYLAAVELPNHVAEHIIHTAIAALDLMETLDRFNAHTRDKLKLHIGIPGRLPDVKDGASGLPD